MIVIRGKKSLDGLAKNFQMWKAFSFQHYLEKI